MDEQKAGYFESEPGEKSMGRLLSFVACISGIIIFGGAAILALYKGADVGSNILAGCMALVGIGVTGKTVEYFAQK